MFWLKKILFHVIIGFPISILLFDLIASFFSPLNDISDLLFNLAVLLFGEKLGNVLFALWAFGLYLALYHLFWESKPDEDDDDNDEEDAEDEDDDDDDEEDAEDEDDDDDDEEDDEDEDDDDDDEPPSPPETDGEPKIRRDFKLPHSVSGLN